MISYSALKSYGKATLPSVEVWNGNFNITKDPPSGIHTRRIIKVGDDNSLLDWNDDSGSRINEMINVYSRGQNPMVTVQYSNHGNTGKGSTISSNLMSGGGGKLPYRVMNKGAFRPPILRQEDLTPLSRMPRLCTSVTSKRCRVDQTKKIKPDVMEYFREIHRDPLKVTAEAKRSFKKEGPQAPPTNINLMVNSKAMANTVETKRSFKKEGPQAPPTNIDLMINSKSMTNTVTSNTRKLKDTGDQRNIPVLDGVLLTTNVDHINQKRISQQKYIHGDIQLEKNIPNHEVQSTNNLNIRPNKNIYELAGQTVKLTDNRPSRPVSNFGANSGGTMVKLNQPKMIQGVTLKRRGVH
jgi:hypothetical protein